MEAYYSLWNRFSVYDLETLFPSIHALDTLLSDYDQSLPKQSKASRSVLLQTWVTTQLQQSSSPLYTALRAFYAATNELLSAQKPVQTGARLEVHARIAPAVVSLNGLWDALSAGADIEDALLSMYERGYLDEIVGYVKRLQSMRNEEATGNTNSERTASVGSVWNMGSHATQGTQGTNVGNVGNEGIFGPLEGGFFRRIQTRRRAKRGKRTRFAYRGRRRR